MNNLSWYLASAWHRRLELRRYAYSLRYLGVEITSRWLDEKHQASDVIPTKADPRPRRVADLVDIRRASMFVRFADPEYFTKEKMVPKHLLLASRFVEQGYATALGKKIYVIGGNKDGKVQPVFDELANTCHVSDFAEFVQLLTLVEGQVA